MKKKLLTMSFMLFMFGSYSHIVHAETNTLEIPVATVDKIKDPMLKSTSNQTLLSTFNGEVKKDRTHIVRFGENWSTIAKKYKTTADKLIALNPDSEILPAFGSKVIVQKHLTLTLPKDKVECASEREKIKKEEERIRLENKQKEETEKKEIQQRLQKNDTVDTSNSIDNSFGQLDYLEQEADFERNDNNESINAEFTFYYPANDVSQGAGITATGHDLYASRFFNGYRIMAAPPNYPFYSLLEVTYDGKTFIGVVLDRGGAIQGNHFDIAVDNHDEAYSNGRKWGTVKLIGKL